MDAILQDISVLRQKSERITDIAEIKDILVRLEASLGSVDNGVGLSAIQIGIPKAVGLINYQKGPGDQMRRLELINPEFVSGEDEFIFGNEGCLSFPGEFRNTNRFRNYVIRTDVIDGDELRTETLLFYYAPDAKEMGHSGIVAIAVQHEMDHFEGKLLIDYNIESKPQERDAAKVGRNDPCPCGSGKKYKKCCI